MHFLFLEHCSVSLFVPKNDPTSIKTAVRSASEKNFCFVNDRPGNNALKAYQNNFFSI